MCAQLSLLLLVTIGPEAIYLRLLFVAWLAKQLEVVQVIRTSYADRFNVVDGGKPHRLAATLAVWSIALEQLAANLRAILQKSTAVLVLVALVIEGLPETLGPEVLVAVLASAGPHDADSLNEPRKILGPRFDGRLLVPVIYRVPDVFRHGGNSRSAFSLS